MQEHWRNLPPHCEDGEPETHVSVFPLAQLSRHSGELFYKWAHVWFINTKRVGVQDSELDVDFSPSSAASWLYDFK